jgi:hypothetical protein
MMGQQQNEPQLINYAVNLEKRCGAIIRCAGSRRLIFILRQEVVRCYGKNGNEAVAPEVILKMVFLLFFDDIKSERELMEVIGERSRPRRESGRDHTIMAERDHEH